MAALHVSPEAREDLRDIMEYISAELANPSAAQGVVAKIIKAMRGLGQFPDSGTQLSSVLELHTDYRFVPSGNYLVFYRHLGEEVYIVRVLYGRRDYMRILFGEQAEDE